MIDTKNNMLLQRRRETGYTLVELMIVLVILGVLASWGIPMYFDNVRDARRSDAIGSLNRVLAQQELFYSNNQSNYTVSVANLGFGGFSGSAIFGGTFPGFGGPDTTVSEDNHYAIKLGPCAAPNGSTSVCIQLEATPVAGSSQAKDTDCALIAINSMGRQTARKADNSNNNQECWN